MRRLWTGMAIAAVAAAWGARPAVAQDWQPVSRRQPTIVTTMRPPAPPAGITLGRPESARPAVAAEPPAPADSTPALFTTGMGSYPPPARTQWTTVRAQGPDGGTPAYGFGAPPLSSEEQFNCGVVTEGPASGGHPLLSGPKSLWDKLFGGCNNPCGPMGGQQGFQSDHAFDSFASPISNPYFFEDPRALTEFKPVFVYQKSPDSNLLMRGGSATFYTFQGRLAFNEQWSLVIHRLGFTNVNPGPPLAGAPPGSITAFDGGTGFADIQVGPKFTFYRNEQTNTLAAFGLNFDIPTGSDTVLQGNGGGVTPYLSFGQEFLGFHVLATGGYRFGFTNHRSDSLFTSLHLDYGINTNYRYLKTIYPVAELNWWHYTQNGSLRAANFEGQDLFNLGSTDVSGNNFVSVALGLRFKFTESLQAGAVYEFPVLGREDLMRYRLTFDLIFRY